MRSDLARWPTEGYRDPEKRPFVADVWELENLDTSEIHARRLTAKGTFIFLELHSAENQCNHRGLGIQATSNRGPRPTTLLSNGNRTTPRRAESSTGNDQLGPRSGRSAGDDSLSSLGPYLERDLFELF